MTENFMKNGYSAEQAKLKVVWENPKIASICSAMSSMTILQANVAAALDKKSLSLLDKQRMMRYAEGTAPGYCAGCADICESALDRTVPICDILRYSMYDCSYGDRARAKAELGALPESIKSNALGADYSKAEQRCPQGVQIGKIIRQVHRDLC